MVSNDTLLAVGASVAAAGIVSLVSSLTEDAPQGETATTPISAIPTADDIAQAVRENVDPTDTPTDPDTDLSDDEERNAREGLGADEPDTSDGSGGVPDSPWTGGWSDLTGYSPYGIGTRIGLNEGDDAEDGDPLVGL